MEKQQRLSNVLDFYIKSNNLKTTIFDEKTDESYADYLFGSLLLATLINSEFKESKDLGKIYRMILLKGIGTLNTDYNFDGLRKQNLLQDELEEIKENRTYEANLANRYMRIEYLMNRFIDEYENKFLPDKFIQQGANRIAVLLRQEPKKCEEIFKCYYLNKKLRNSVRTGWDRNHWNISAPRVERISEHVTSTMALALGLSSEFPHDIDYTKVFKMLSNHELGETLIGDITPFDNITPEEKKDMEHQAMDDALGNLSGKEELLNLLFEFDEQETKEAKFAHYCDKIDADLQSKLYQDQGYHHSLDDQSRNMVFLNPKAQKYVLDGATTPFDIWYLWDKKIYENDKEFPEFIELLRTAKESNLVDTKNRQKIKED